ncbi:hypothetical protein [Psychromonas sp. Urea-02u-13]|nr:hypothetical protein [Psychromonas sp. Urea-02u-13]
MKNTIQLISIVVASLILGMAIIFSSAPQAEPLSEWPYDYWYMLGSYQAN